jgi:two-component system, LytTR family, response regulator
MNCIIIDDEPLAQEIIEEYIGKVPFLNLVAKCSSAFDAFDALRQHTVDLIFLDIHMPHINGIDFIKSIEYKPMFILTTAYSEHALESYEINALDYLLKPIPFNRFIKAVNKAYDLYSLKKKSENGSAAPLPKPTSNATEKFLLVKTDYQTVRIDLENVLYIEGLKDYVKIYTSNAKPVITLNSLKKLSEKLPNDDFVRVHKSFIISLSKIQSMSRGRIYIGDKVIPIGDSYKDFFNELINKHNITK